MLGYIKRLKRKLRRLEGRRDELEGDHKGNEQKYTYHAGFSLGYVKGQINEIEDFISELNTYPINQ